MLHAVPAAAQKSGQTTSPETKPAPVRLVPGEHEGVRCDAVVLVDAYQRLGVFGVASTMGGALTNATGAGLAAAVNYCNIYPKDCASVAESFRPRLGFTSGGC